MDSHPGTHSSDSTGSLHITGNDIPISYVFLHGLLHFAHPKLVASITNSCREGKLSQNTSLGVVVGQGGCTISVLCSLGSLAVSSEYTF